MTNTVRTLILRVNALFLLIASFGGLVSDLRGAFLLQGPVGRVVGSAPYAVIGLVEAHGLAFIVGILLWRASPARSWHVTAMAVHALLGTANLVFWEVFTATDMLVVGYVTTTLHWLFFTAQLLAATASDQNQS